MKNLSFITALLIAVTFMAVSCDKKNKEDATKLSVTYTPEDISAAGGTATFSITCNADWTITADSWLTPDQTTGNGDATIGVTVAANTGDARQGTLTVKARNKTERVTINQLAYVPVTEATIYETGATATELSAALDQCTIIDKDGDGVCWKFVEFEDDNGNPTGDFGITSWSWSLSGPLFPEDYLILPAQTIGTGAKFTVNMYASDTDWYLEKFKIIVSDQPITNANCRDAETILENTLDTPDRTDYVAEIPAAYNNGTVYVGVCHFDTSDQFTIVIQSMKLTHETTSQGGAPPIVPQPTDKTFTGKYYPAHRAK